jgi:hypothetical protein
MKNNEIRDLIVKFRNLSEEGQKEFIKELMINGYLPNFVDYKVDKFVPSVGTKSIYESAKNSYKERLEEKIDKTINKTLGQLRSSDEELKYRLFDRFLECYDKVVQEERVNICNEVHDFSGWVEKDGERPIFDKYGNIDTFAYGKWFERQCYYCGTIQKAWDVEQKKMLEEQQKTLKLKNKNKRKNNI